MLFIRENGSVEHLFYKTLIYKECGFRSPVLLRSGEEVAASRGGAGFWWRRRKTRSTSLSQRRHRGSRHRRDPSTERRSEGAAEGGRRRAEVAGSERPCFAGEAGLTPLTKPQSLLGSMHLGAPGNVRPA